MPAPANSDGTGRCGAGGGGGTGVAAVNDELLPPVAHHAETAVLVPVPERREGWPRPHLESMQKYRSMHKESLEHPERFFGNMARELLHWSKPFTVVTSGSLDDGDFTWFQDGEINACYNCVDRNALARPNEVAILYEADEPGHSQKITYRQLLHEVCRLANALHSFGLRKGDTVAVYMPMIPAAVIALLACARIGLVHSVVFAGFSAESLRDRIQDAASSVVLTTDEGRRGGKIISTKKIVDEALAHCPTVRRVLVYQHTGNEAVASAMVAGRDVFWHEEVAHHMPYCPPARLNAEDPLFLLYTSGSTGKAKGLVHTIGGYLFGATATTKYVFDAHPGDILGCMADIGWITGHTYIVYGPLALGLTTVVFESTPVYPDPSRYWKLVAEHKLTHFYTAPTAIRALRRLGDKWIEGHDLSSLRLLGSVGEPINPEAWHWYNSAVGKGRCMVIDTYWQTETGCHVITPFSAVAPTKPGSASFPFFGIEPVILDPMTGQAVEPSSTQDISGLLAFKRHWPSLARTVRGDHKRFMATYIEPYKGYYFTGDGATLDKDGYLWIDGRVDDVINVSGHRLSTAEIESALILHPAVAEAAVVGAPDDLTGQAIICFVTLKPDMKVLEADLKMQVRKAIGPFATPRQCVVVEADLPKTRSGKIMRRILRKIAAGEADNLGDTSTLADPSVVQYLIDRFKRAAAI